MTDDQELSPMEEFKLQLQLAAKTKSVRLGQSRDHLIWTRIDQSGDSYNTYIFVLQDHENTVVEVFPGRCLVFGNGDGRATFLRDVANGGELVRFDSTWSDSENQEY